MPQDDTLTYFITVRNGGPGAATNVTLTDTLPGGVAFLSASPPCTGMAIVVCTFGDVANGAVVSVSIQVQVPATPMGSLTNSAAISADRDPNPANNTAVTTTPVGAPPVTP